MSFAAWAGIVMLLDRPLRPLVRPERRYLARNDRTGPQTGPGRQTAFHPQERAHGRRNLPHPASTSSAFGSRVRALVWTIGPARRGRGGRAGTALRFTEARGLVDLGGACAWEPMPGSLFLDPRGADTWTRQCRPYIESGIAIELVLHLAPRASDIAGSRGL